ncbi:MAG: sigma-70 family RNA polymerase sigma factor [Candidatus Peribacteraceae bacterium]|nr:sigma-70 family RNA polymerase sigma factor [Candidatus Peribacteraceae bacterium]
MTNDERNEIYLKWESYIHGVIYEFTMRHKIDYQLIEDLRQEVAMHMMKVIPDYNPKLSQIQTYLYNRTYQFLLDYFSKEWRRARIRKVHHVETKHLFDPEFIDPDGTEEFELILNQAPTVSKQQKMYLRLRYIGGLTDEEIAKSVGLERSTITKHIGRALTKLKVITKSR